MRVVASAPGGLSAQTGKRAQRLRPNDENDPPSFSNESGLDFNSAFDTDCTDASVATSGSGWIGIGLRGGGSASPSGYMDPGSLTNYGLPLKIVRTDDEMEDAVLHLLRRDRNISHRMIFNRILRVNINAREALLGLGSSLIRDVAGEKREEEDRDTSRGDEGQDKAEGEGSSPVLVKRKVILSDNCRLPNLRFNHVKSVAIRVRRRLRAEGRRGVPARSRISSPN
jgi:hypothetical protein